LNNVLIPRDILADFNTATFSDASRIFVMALADSIKEVVGSDYFYKFDRSGERAQRNPKEIGISAERCSTRCIQLLIVVLFNQFHIKARITEYSCSILEQLEFDRSGERAQRNPKEIGISAVRGGTIVGEHEVIFAGEEFHIKARITEYSCSILEQLE